MIRTRGGTERWAISSSPSSCHFHRCHQHVRRVIWCLSSLIAVMVGQNICLPFYTSNLLLFSFPLFFLLVSFFLSSLSSFTASPLTLLEMKLSPFVIRGSLLLKSKKDSVYTKEKFFWNPEWFSSIFKPEGREWEKLKLNLKERKKKQRTHRDQVAFPDKFFSYSLSMFLSSFSISDFLE